MHKRVLPWLAPLAACASEPAVVAVAGTPAGAPLELRLREDGFVELDGLRVAVEEAIYELRLRCRAAGADAAARPWLRIVAPRSDGEALAGLVDRLRDEAYDAGVRHLEFALEGS